MNKLHLPIRLAPASRRLLSITILGLITLLASCAGPRKSIYFKDVAPLDPTIQTQKMDKVKEVIIQSDDILAINVSTISSILEPTSPTNLFNDGGTAFSVSSASGSEMGPASGKGYLVDPLGYIDFPVIGKTKVGGMTIRQAKDAMALKLKNYVKEPVVELRIINYRITVLGEVNRPGAIIAPNHKMSVIDAIAAAGDIPITGRKDNITVIREIEGTREFAHLNLNSKEVFTSPYFYLKQNDIIYVEPARLRRQEGNDFFRFYLPTISTLLSTVLGVYGILQITK
jgi:polysaccharide biosynthesis/export protein